MQSQKAFYDFLFFLSKKKYVFRSKNFAIKAYTPIFAVRF